MTETEFGTFDEMFRRLAVTFRLKLKAVQLQELARNYFKILETTRLEDVLVGAKKCLASCRRFPTPAEWLLALPTSTAETAKDQRVMRADDVAEYHRAEALLYADAACVCLMCQAANVTHRPLRFVPDFFDNGEEMRAFDNVRQRVVVTGHWAHGDELARWYAARDRFYASAPRKSSIVKALLELTAGREPGQEG